MFASSFLCHWWPLPFSDGDSGVLEALFLRLCCGHSRLTRLVQGIMTKPFVFANHVVHGKAGQLDVY